MSKIQWETPKVTVEQVPDHNGSVPVYNKSDFVIQDGVLVEYTGNGGDILIPSKVSKIGKNAFEGCMMLTNVEFPPTVEEIGDYAFYGCRNLKKIKFPPTVKVIGDYAFYGCRNLKKIKFPPELDYIGGYAFYECGCLTIKNLINVKKIAKDAFAGVTLKNKNQEDFVIKDGVLVQYIGKDSLVCIPSTVSTIGHHAFAKVQNIVCVIIPSSVTSIEYYAFSNCLHLATVEMTSSINVIGDYAFENCVNLENIEIPSNIFLGRGVFSGAFSHKPQ